MRAFVIVLMIALLPLRAWLGDAMAQELALPQLVAAAHSSSLHADCALHSEQAAPQADEATDQPGGCSACQLCHSVAMESAPLVLAVLALPRAVLAVAASDFASAERALSVKPPIA
jgi:hypothetical protein